MKKREMVYRDCLGRPVSHATISVFGSDYGKPGTGYFALLTTIDNYPARKWPYTSKDVSHIVAEMEAEGWECEVTHDGYNAPVIKCTHLATQSIIDAKIKEYDDKFKNAERGFVRFGDIPKCGYSINHRDKIPEAGVSVFEAEFVGNSFRPILTPQLEVTYVACQGRPAYRVYGDVVGTGADGEPVLRVKRIVKLKK